MDNDRGKTICFIDESNIFHGQEEAGWKIDWRKFQEYLERSGPVWQTFFFSSAFDPQEEIQNNFYQFVRETLRWEVHLYELGRKTVRCRHCDHEETVVTEKGVDVGVATKMLTLGIARAFETAVLVAGDRDYLEPVKTLKGMGLRVEVVSWRRGLSRELSEESSEAVLYLEDLREEIERRDGEGASA